jgi:hypothetical protein
MIARARRIENLALGGYLRISQHSTILTASPPRAVSLYLIFMSAPVCIMVLITLSRLTVCRPSPWSASRAAVIAFTEATAFVRCKESERVRLLDRR